MTSEFTIDKLPFYWRLSQLAQKTKNVVPDCMQFDFDLVEETGLIIQKRNDSVLEALATIYKQEYNIGYLQDANEIAKPYGVDFIRFLKRAINYGSGAQRILEIGCGGCVVLDSLKKDGHDVLGIDSSPFAAVQGQKKQISVVTGFYPLHKLKEKFNLIFHVDVLEHIDKPVEFLRSHRDNLYDGGLVVVNVPDATESIDIGDISLAMHQHLNYFTESSLRATLESAGFHVESIEKAQYGGSLYATARHLKVKSGNDQDRLAHKLVFDEFLDKANRNLLRFSEVVTPLLVHGHRELGFYVPLRTLPYIAALRISKGFRFFDDTTHWHQCVFDGVDVEIENFEDLKKNPVKCIFVMSLTFGDVIKRKIATEFGQSIKVVTLPELIRHATS